MSEVIRFDMDSRYPDDYMQGQEVGVSSPSIQPEAITFLQNQTWPGNVRELENTVRQALLSAKTFTITVDHVREVLA
jgi:DNA-binding NtrC family response regulator